ncbi:RHS repeat-associated core domain-containing protein [Agromyces silvae]|uniref:RHS repeat-associated core domain-containing protein n=1 Tax=Agromyces silvae TaxID=3388266 RepID=UPI00280BE20A|nr:RHS repeat-associated core domain-containing protein [Agromyces protaetiae]
MDRYGFGVGWGLGFAVVEVEGGVRVSPASGGVFEAADSVPSGLLGYAGSDVVFRQVPGGVLPGRADGVVGAQSYAFELHELGGVITYFNAAGDPVAKVAAGGDRSDWGWVAGNPHRLGSVVSVDGVVTELDWSDPGEVLVRPGVNVPAEGGGAGVWRVQLVDGRVGEVADPVGGRSLVGYDRAGRVERVVSGSGAVTTVSWRSDTDAVSRVDRVAVTDSDGTELSARRWRQVDGVLPSGWPAVDPASVSGAVAGAVGGARSVEVSDGKTRVVSSFDEWGRLAGKRVVVSSSAGEQTVQEQELTYPDGDPVGVGDLARKPVAAEVRSLDVSGGVRAGTESYEYDDLGRMVRRESADGTVLERGYDREISKGRLLPVGSPVSERSTAPDGSVTTTETTLDDTRTVPVLVEQTMQAPGGAAVVTGRTEYTVEDGVVVEQREYPGGDAGAAGAAPVATRWDETIDLERGVREVVETVAAGTELAASTSSTTSLLHGGALESTDVLGHMSSADYDELGRPVSARDAADRVTTTAYAPADGGFGGFGGDQVTVTGPDGVAVTEVRDVLGRVVQKHDNLNPDGDPVAGEVRVFERHGFPAPGVEEITDAWGATTRVEQDVHGRAARATLANGLVQVTEHDDVHGTVTSGSTPTGRLADAAQITTSRMDVSGRETGTDGTRADGVPVPETSTVYDGFGRELQTSNGATRTSVEFDAHGNPATTTISPEDPAAAADALVAERRFDGFGTSLEKTMSAGGQERSGGSRELDVLGRTVTETDQVGAITGYEYTVDGLPERVTTSAGQVTTYAYDDTSRAVIEVRVEAPGQQAVVTGYAYDEVTGRVTAVFDPAERVGTEITYSYDGFGNIRTVQYPAEQAGAARPAIAHEYDRHGRKTATTDVAGNRTAFSYADDGFLTGVVQTDADGDELARVGYSPDEYGRIQQVARGNGVVTEYAFTSAGEIESETTTGPDGAVQAEREYEYDPATGNLLVRIDRVRDEASGDLDVERREYAYDHLGRLTASTIRDGDAADAPATQSVAYEIGVSGQVAAETITDETSGTITTRDFAYSPVGALVAIATTGPEGVPQTAPQEHDAAGNLMSAADGSRYEWDAANRQIAQILADGTRIEQTYWADGTRKGRATDAGSTTYYWDDTALINDAHAADDETEADGVASYLIGAFRHARTTHADAAETQYYSTDRHGNVTGLTDDSGAAAGTYAYSDYGVATAGTGVIAQAAGLPGAVGQLGYNPFQYALEYTHTDGTQFLRERTYDPGQLSFTSKDREALHDLYGYANANPIMMVDPSGRASMWDVITVTLNNFGSLAGAVGAFWALSPANGGLGLVVLGFAAIAFAVADMAFTAVETHAILTDTKFMSDDEALATGIGLAGAGAVFGIAGGLGKLTSRTTTKVVDPKAGPKPGSTTPDQTVAAKTKVEPVIPETKVESVTPESRIEAAHRNAQRLGMGWTIGKRAADFLGSPDHHATSYPLDVLAQVLKKTTGHWDEAAKAGNFSPEIGTAVRGSIGAVTAQLEQGGIVAAQRALMMRSTGQDELLQFIDDANREVDVIHTELTKISELTKDLSSIPAEFTEGLALAHIMAKSFLKKF